MKLLSIVNNYHPAYVSTMGEGADLETKAHESFSTDKVTKKAKVKVFFQESESESVFQRKRK